MVSWNNSFLCVLILGILTDFVAVCYGSKGDMRPLRHVNDEVDSTKIWSKFRRDGRSYAHEFGNTTGFITRNGSLAFDFNNETNAADVHSLYLLKNAKLQRVEPVVQCTEDVMTVRVTVARTPRFLVDDGEGFLIPWTRMPSHCGFSVTRSLRDVLFVAPYKGCHVTEQGGKHVLHLRLWGEPATMSCPVLPSPLSVTCFAYGMLLNMGNITADAIKVKVYDVWKPVLSSGELCGFAMVSHLSKTMITAPYKEPCFKIKDEKHVLDLNANGQEVSVSCPSPVDPLQPSATTATPTIGASSESQSTELFSFPGHHQFPRSPPFPGGYLTTDTRAAPTELPQYSEFLRTYPTTTRAGPADPQSTMSTQHPGSPEFPGFLQFLRSPEFHRSTKHPGFPQYPGFLQNPGSTEFPGSIEFPESTEYPGSSEIPGSPEYPGFLQLNWFPQFPGSPEILEYPGFSQFPGSPEIPEYPDFSQFPGSPEYPEYTGFSQSPGSPEIPEYPDFSQFPGSPEYPEYTGFSQSPGSPEIPEYPGFSQFPGSPEIPEYPSFSQFPGSPEIPGFPQFPGSIEYPGFPKLPEFPQYPGFTRHVPWFTNPRAVPADPQIRGFRQFPRSFLATARGVPKIPELSSYPGFPIHTSEASGWKKAALYNPWKQKGEHHIEDETVMYQDHPSSQSSVTLTPSRTPRSSATAGVED